MNLRILRSAKSAFSSLRNRFTPKGLILLYHRVADVPVDPFRLCVKPSHFAEQLEVIQNYCNPMSLQQLVQAVQTGKCPQRAVAITFDDGYVDNLNYAKPLLERFSIPATVFIATGNLDRQREFWWDELERLFLQPNTLPTQLQLQIGKQTYKWDLSGSESYSEEAYQRDKGWNWYRSEADDPTTRHSLYRSLYQILQPLSSDERQRQMDELVLWSGAEIQGRSTHRSLSSEEVLILSKEGLIEIGAHTVTHPHLSKIPERDQREEIQKSKLDLENLLEKSVDSFAYPHGDYTEVSVNLVQESGFHYACSTIPRSIQGNLDYFQLPRVEVQDWDREAFTQWLLHLFHN